MTKFLADAKTKLLYALDLVKKTNYPRILAAGKPNLQTLEFVQTTNVRNIAEIGIYEGSTSNGFAEYLNNDGTLYLFDYSDRVKSVEEQLRQRGYTNVRSFGNSHKLNDSYNWTLMRLLQKHDTPLFDYVFLDGAHTWHVDALTFFLVDRLLKPGGYIDFDDYDWSLEVSPSLNPERFPPTRRQYTSDQISERHVKLIIELLVRRSPNYREIVENKIFQKSASV